MLRCHLKVNNSNKLIYSIFPTLITVSFTWLKAYMLPLKKSLSCCRAHLLLKLKSSKKWQRSSLLLNKTYLIVFDCFCANSAKCFLAFLSFSVNSSDILTFPFNFLPAFSIRFFSFKLEHLTRIGNGFFFPSWNLSASSTSTF